MDKGLNKADFLNKVIRILENKNDRICVFLSYKSEDRVACREIAEYFKNANIDYYLDEIDDDLQIAVIAENPEQITEHIKTGIRSSTHMLVVISEKTFKSPWIPFEVGYGHASILDKYDKDEIKENKINLSILTLKDISEISLPDFMFTAYIIRGTKSLNDYIAKISKKLEKSLINENLIIPYTKETHPLDVFLNWKL